MHLVKLGPDSVLLVNIQTASVNKITQAFGNFLLFKYRILVTYIKKVSWCSWLSRQSNTLKVSGSNPGEAIFSKHFYIFFPKPFLFKKKKKLVFLFYFSLLSLNHFNLIPHFRKIQSSQIDYRNGFCVASNRSKRDKARRPYLHLENCICLCSSWSV